jgi:hypothetical protein
MTLEDLLNVRDQQVPLTGRLCIALAEALINVHDACNADSAHAASQGAGHPFIFGYKTFQRVALSAIQDAPLPVAHVVESR